MCQLSLGQLAKPLYDVVQSGTERIFVTVLDPFEGVFLSEIINNLDISVYICKYVMYLSYEKIKFYLRLGSSDWHVLDIEYDTMIRQQHGGTKRCLLYHRYKIL